MIVTKKALSRRTFLRGAGTALALPLLDAMIPSMTGLAQTPAAPQRLRRLSYVYIPMGGDTTRWTPPAWEPRIFVSACCCSSKAAAASAAWRGRLLRIT